MGWIQEALDRGVTIRKAVRFDHKNEYKFVPAYGGLEVYMFKDKPGEFYDSHGNKVSEEAAGLAGFSVDKLKREKVLRDKMAGVMKEMQDKVDELRAMSNPDVIAAEGNFQVIRLPAGKAQVVDMEFNKVTPLPIPEQDAIDLLAKLTQAPDEGTLDSVQVKSKKE